MNNTLIALVVTIVVLLILAGITISLVFGQNGVIKQAQEAEEKTKIEQVREQLELAKGPEYIEGNGKYNPDSYFERIEEEEIINDKEKDVLEIGEGKYEVTTALGYIFIITLVPSKDNVEDIEIEYVGKVDEPRIRKITVTNKTTNSISIEVETANTEGATYRYYYKKEGETDWIKADEIEEYIYTFSGLEANKVYNIKVEVEKDGKVAEKETGTITGEMPEGAVQFSPIEWNNGEASTTITTSEEGYTLQYQKNEITEGSWINTTSGTVISGLKYGERVYGRLYDGTNGSNTANAEIKDEISPIISSFNVSTFDISSITTKVDATDNQSGIAKYQFEYKLVTETDYAVMETVNTTSASYTYKYNGLVDGTAYNLRVSVYDKAENQITSKVITQSTKIANVAPSAPTVTFNSKTTNSISINTKAIDNNGDNLTYKLYISTSQNSEFTEKAISSEVTSGTQVTLQATGLNQYTTYYYYVEVTDGKEKAKSTTSSVKTYCPGTGLTCNGPFTTTTTCSSCAGSGEQTRSYHMAQLRYTPTASWHSGTCDKCGRKTEIQTTALTCTVCREKWADGFCSSCQAPFLSGSTVSYVSDWAGPCIGGTCSTCNGTGKVTKNISCTHGKTSTHNYCSHGYTSQHD